jgi:WD40 repeat protein
VAREQRGRVPVSQVVALGTDLARALAGLHARGLVHRDVKPSNVIFVSGQPKLADIGLVAFATSAQTFVGTEGFVPPEGPGTPAADVFSLGKLLYELATGLDRLDYPKLPDDLETLADRRQLLELNEILIRACDPNPARRYPDAEALLDDLRLLQAGRSMRRLRAAERSVARTLRASAALGLAAAITGAGMYVERQRARHEGAQRRKVEWERDDLAQKAVYSAGLARAQRSIELGDFGQARRHLGDLVPAAGGRDHRGFEWHMLWAEAQGDPADVLLPGGPTVEKVRFAPDGSQLAWQGSDMRVTVWDIASHKPVRTIEGILSLAGFSADSRWLVGSDPRAMLGRWSIATGQPDLQPAHSVSRPLAPSPDGASGVCFTESEDGILPHALRIWDFDRHAETMSLPIAPDADGEHWDYFRAAVSENNRVCGLVLVAGRGHEAHWRLQSLDLVARKTLWTQSLLHPPVALSLSPDDSRMAVVFGDSGEVRLLDLATGAWLWQQDFDSSRSEALAFSPDGSRLAIAGHDSAIQVVDADTGGVLNVLRGQNGGVADLAWSPDGQTLASGSTMGELRLWAAPMRSNPRLIGGDWVAPQRSSFGCACVSRDGKRLAVSHNGIQVRVLDTDTLAVRAELPETARPVCFTDGSDALLTVTPRGRLKWWRLDRPVPEAEEFAPFADASTGKVTLSQDEHWLAAADMSGRIQVWDWPARHRLFEQKAHKLLTWELAFSPDGTSLASVGDDRTIKLWDPRTGQLRVAWSAESTPLNACYSPRDQTLAVGLGQGRVQLHGADPLAPRRELQTSQARSTSLAFSPDGSRLVCGGPNGLLQVFATDDWREVTTLVAVGTRESVPNPGNDSVINLQFSANGRVLVAYMANGRLRVWRR